MLSQTVEYALRAVVHLSSVSPSPQTTEEIARVTRVPQAYLAKVLQCLVQSGLLRSQRGIGGGISLARKPSEMTILEVVNAVDPIQRIRSCPLGLESHGTHLCPLHKRVDEALASVEAAFRSSTLQEVIDEPSKSVPLCDVLTRKEPLEPHAS